MKELVHRFAAFAEKHKTFLAFCLLAAAVFAVYGQSVKYDYVFFDDNALVLKDYDRISNLKNVPSFFCHSVFNSNFECFYRPLLTISIAVDAAIGGKNPAVYHLTGVLLHLASVFMIFVFLKRLGFDRILVFFTTLVFAVHPSLSHAVVWIPGRNDTLFFVFLIAALIFLFDYFKSGKSGKYKLVLFTFALFAALLTKENAVMFLAVLPVFIFLFCEKPSKRDYFNVLATALVAAAIYMVMRSFAVCTVSTSGMFERLLKSLKMFFVYIEYFIIPARIQVLPANVYTGPLTLAACLIAAVPIVASFSLKIGRKSVVAFGLFWFVVFLFPTFLTTDYWFLHRLYVPAVGLVIVFLEFMTALSEREERTKKYFIFLLAAFAVVFAFATRVQMAKFENRAVFLANAVTENPGSESIRTDIASYYISIGRFDKAKEELKTVLSFGGSHGVRFYTDLAYVLYVEGDYEASKELFEKIYEKNGDKDSFTVQKLSEIYEKLGDHKKATEYALKLVNPSSSGKFAAGFEGEKNP